MAYSERKKNNAMALHAIQISCNREILSLIMGIKYANEAYEFLKRYAEPTLYFDKPFSGLENHQPPSAEDSTGKLPVTPQNPGVR